MVKRIGMILWNSTDWTTPETLQTFPVVIFKSIRLDCAFIYWFSSLCIHSVLCKFDFLVMYSFCSFKGDFGGPNMIVDTSWRERCLKEIFGGPNLILGNQNQFWEPRVDFGTRGTLCLVVKYFERIPRFSQNSENSPTSKLINSLHILRGNLDRSCLVKIKKFSNQVSDASG
jgi:hypothetical protein